jgi:hypothetical protein
MTSIDRDDFPESTKRALAERVGSRCSNPDCRALTSGPQTNVSKSLNLGVAAHITSAAAGGPRYDPTLTSEQRADITNGIWLCQNCAKLVDNDPVRFSTELLQEWKSTAEQEAFDRVGKTGPDRVNIHAVVDKWVNTTYIEKAGITKELRNQGYELRWTNANRESEMIDLEGWEPVLVSQQDGTMARLKILDHTANGGYLILLKRRKS